MKVKNRRVDGTPPPERVVWEDLEVGEAFTWGHGITCAVKTTETECFSFHTCATQRASTGSFGDAGLRRVPAELVWSDPEKES